MYVQNCTVERPSMVLNPYSGGKEPLYRARQAQHQFPCRTQKGRRTAKTKQFTRSSVAATHGTLD